MPYSNNPAINSSICRAHDAYVTHHPSEDLTTEERVAIWLTEVAERVELSKWDDRDEANNIYYYYLPEGTLAVEDTGYSIESAILNCGGCDNDMKPYVKFMKQ